MTRRRLHRDAGRNIKRRAVSILLAAAIFSALLPPILPDTARAVPPGDPIENSDGYSYSASVPSNPIEGAFRLTGYGTSNDATRWPNGGSGLSLGSTAFSGAVYDGAGSVWLVPYNSNAVVQVDTATGAMTAYPFGSQTPGVTPSAGDKFQGGVLVGEEIWMVPCNASVAVKVNTTTGAMAQYPLPGVGTSSGRFIGGTYDGRYIWMAPSYATAVLRLDPTDGTMTTFNNWPAGFNGSGGGKFYSAAYDGSRYLYLIPQNADRVVRLDTQNPTAQMVGYSNWTGSGTTGATGARFWGGVVENGALWMVPRNAANAVKMDPDTGAMTALPWPAGFSKVDNAYFDGVFDGRYLWMAPASQNQIARIDTAAGTADADRVAAYNRWNDLAGFTKGGNAFLRGTFDGRNVWFAPANAGRVVKLSPLEKVTVTAAPTTRVAAPNSVNIAVKAENGQRTKYDGTAAVIGQIVSMDWFRVPTSDTTNYDPNPDRTSTEFATKYAAVAAADKGTIANSGSTVVDEYTFHLAAAKNGNYWVKVNYVDGDGVSTFDVVRSISIKNIYTPFLINTRGHETGTAHYLYGTASSYAPYATDLAIPYDLNGTAAIAGAPLGYDAVTFSLPAQYSDHWTAALGGNPLPHTATLNAAFLTNSLADDSGRHNYTIDYTKVSGRWEDIPAEFILADGSPVPTAWGSAGGSISAPLASTTPGDFASTQFLQHGGWYTPPSDTNYYPVGYSVGVNYIGSYQTCSDFTIFNPNIPVGTTKIYIIYQSVGAIIPERHWQDGSTNEVWPNTQTIVPVGDPYTASARSVLGQVAVGYTVDGSASVDGDYTGTTVTIPYSELVPGDTMVTFWYKNDFNQNGLPDDEEVAVTTHWVGRYQTGGSNALLHTETVGALLNQPFTATNDGSPPGDPAHVIPDATSGAWVFDSTTSETQTITPSGDATLTFFYDYATDGVTPDKEQYVIATFQLQGGNGTPPADTKTHVLKGGAYSGTARDIADYVPYGYQIDGASVVEFPVGGPYTVGIDPTTQNTHTVTFIYKAAGESVTVRWVGRTYSGTEATMSTLTLAGYDGQSFTVTPADAPAPIDPVSWAYDSTTSTVPPTITLDGTAGREYIFYYDEIASHAVITVTGESLDHAVSFSYRQTAPVGDPVFDITAWSIPNYKVNGYVVYDSTDAPIDSGTGSTASIDPSLGSQKVVFEYETTLTTVVIQAIERGSSPANVLYSHTVVDATVGQPFAAVAPFVDNTWALYGALVQTITVTPGTNTITFEYDKVTGNVTVLLKEEDGSGPIIKVVSELVNSGDVRDIAIPDLTAEYFTTLSTTPTEVDNIGVLPVPEVVEYYYTKQRMDVELRAIDESDGSVLQTITLPNAARVGEGYLALAPGVDGYTLTESNHKTVYADPLSPGGTLVVPFEYAADNLGDITVNYFYMDGASKVLLGSYTGTAIVGSKFTALAGDLTAQGFALDSGEPVSREVTVTAAPQTVEFEYVDQRLTVTVSTRTDANPPVQHGAVRYYVAGEDAEVYPPHIPNYTLVSYELDGVSTPVASGFTHVTVSAIAAHHTLLFCYQPSVQAMLDIVITGVDDDTGDVLYSYTVSAPPNSGDVTVTAFALDDYTLVGADTATLPTDGSVTAHTFRHQSLRVTVSILAELDGGGGPVPGYTPVGFIAASGKPFSGNAPFIPGYILCAGEPVSKSIPAVSAVDNILTFSYELATGNVTILLKEDDTDGRVISALTDALGTGESKTYSPPDLTADYYISLSGDRSVTYSGTDLTVEFYYEKQLRPVEAALYDVTDPGNPVLIRTAPLGSLGIGEVARVSAPAEAGYRLVSPSPRSVLITDDPGTQTIRFDYVPLNGDEVLVVALEDATGGILESYRMIRLAGDVVTVSAAQIQNWVLKPGEAATQTRVVPDTIAFRYIPDTPQEVVVRYLNAADGSELKAETVTGQARGSTFVYAAPDLFVQGGRRYTRDAGTPLLHSLVVGDVNEILLYYNDAGPENGGSSGSGGGGGGPSYETATLTVRGVDQDTGEVLYSQTVTVVVGKSETITAPAIAGYLLDDDTVSPVTLRMASGENTVVFKYRYAGAKSGGAGGTLSDRLETTLHIQYLNGYPDGSVRPDGAVTRSEVAAMFFRLLLGEEKHAPIVGSFDDVPADAWYAQSVNYLASIGIVTGYGDGSFRPDRPISRSEFVAIAARLGYLSGSDTAGFPDVPAGHWAGGLIAEAYKLGWINGYPDGTFGPENLITRAESVKIINAMLLRRTRAPDLPAWVVQFTDLEPYHWAYADIMEAANGHDYAYGSDGYEHWK